MKKICLFLLFLLPTAYAAEPETTPAIVNFVVSNMYEQPNAKSPIVSQAIYGTPVAVLQNKHGFSFVKTPDAYHGWVETGDLSFRANDPNASMAKVTSLFAKIYKDDGSMTEVLVNAPFDTELPVIKSNDDWITVLLPDGSSGVVKQSDVLIDPESISVSKMLALSHKFVGLPYIWAGTSTYGFDCSAFVQMLYKQMGVALPRDAILQSYLPGLIDVSRDNLRPGDLMYFGWGDKISHAAIYLGNDKFVNSTAFLKRQVQISNFNLQRWQDLFIVAKRLDTSRLPTFKGSISDLPENVQQNVKHFSWHEGCPVALDNLAYLKLSYFGFDNKPHIGTLIVNKDVANDVVAIFKQLYYQRFPIEKMQTIDAYGGDDNASMLDNNTSAFNCRTMTDYPDQFSIHSYGRAIDINPLINPYVYKNKVTLKEAEMNADRTTYHQGKIISESKIVEDFANHGWTWGGTWTYDVKDYQHFEKSN